MASPLYLVFTLANSDILNCRLATYDRQVAEVEALLAMRANPDRWTRIVEKECSVVSGQSVWIAVSDPLSFSEIEVTVYDQASGVPDGTEWVEDLVVM